MEAYLLPYSVVLLLSTTEYDYYCVEAVAPSLAKLPPTFPTSPPAKKTAYSFPSLRSVLSVLLQPNRAHYAMLA